MYTTINVANLFRNIFMYAFIVIEIFGMLEKRENETENEEVVIHAPPQT